MQTLRFSTIWDLPLRHSRKSQKAKTATRYKQSFLTIWDNPRSSRSKVVSSQRTPTEQSGLTS